MNMSWKEFESPSSRYRGKPFWAWNGKLEPEELRRQIRQVVEDPEKFLHQARQRGFFD